MSLSGFEKESDIEERRKLRQSEWEKVRTADQPETAPEEPYDGRSLYDRLKEQKDAKDLEFEESRKFKNLIRGLDDDDVDHLSEVDRKKLLDERKQKEDEYRELQDYRAKVAEMQEKSVEQKIQLIAAPSKPKIISKISTQKSILIKSVVKRKSAVSNGEEEQPPEKKATKEAIIALPGLGNYDSSDDNSDSDKG